MILNFDETGMMLVPTSGRATIARTGAKAVSIIGVEDKRQVTVTLGVSFSGAKLKPQLIFPGKTAKCLPDALVRAKHDVLCSFR